VVTILMTIQIDARWGADVAATDASTAAEFAGSVSTK